MNFTLFKKAFRQFSGWFSPKILLVMKLTYILVIIGVLQVSAKGFAQKINLDEKNAPLEKVLVKIKKQSGYVFLFTDQQLKNTPITVIVKNVSVTQALDACFKNVPINYKIVDNNILLRDAYSAPSARPVNPAILNQSVHGKITGPDEKPLAGATIRVKGTEVSVVSDANGDFSLNNVPNDATLVISFIGYATREISAQQDLSRIALSLQTSDLNDVVVVGYGTQKKINLTGSVSSVSGATLTERPAINLQDLLEGRIAGLTVIQPSGEVGNDVGSLQIRGLGSYGASSAPLILVDGIESTLSNLSPQDIASVTVLKDAASASLYGSRAANGVILVTTKTGKRGTNKLEYSNSFGTTSATRLPDLITNSVTYMQMFNAAAERSGQPDHYTQAQIDAYKTGAGTAEYPNTDWEKFYYHSAPMQNHNLALSGGDSVSTYYLSAGYQDQKGITDGYDYKKYNAVLNYTRTVNKRISFGTNINFSYQNILTPVYTSQNAILLMYAQAPTYSMFLPDGSGRVAAFDYASNGSFNWSLYARQHCGFIQNLNYNVNAQGYLNINIIKGLDWKTTAATVFFNQDSKNVLHNPLFDMYAFHPDASGNYTDVTNTVFGTFSQFTQYSERDVTLTVNSSLSYHKDLGADHHLDAIAVYEQINNATTYLQGERNNYTDLNITELNGGPTSGWSNAGDQTQYALQSVIGRINYNYKGKYLLEGDIRYDGSSRFGPGNRWGTFGGGSAGWLLSEEDFMKDVTWVNVFKLRGSYGVLGNSNIGIYPYQQVLGSTAYPFGSSLNPGVYLGNLVDQSIHWETTATTDLGLDLSVLKNTLNLTFDWYRKNTTGILASEADVPASVGLSAPTTNAGGMVNKGFEVQLNYQNRIGHDFTYGANVIYAQNRNKVTYILGDGNPGVFQVGLPYNSYYEYVFDGIFQSQAEINSSPAQPNSGNLKPGDIKIKDVNGDGKITPADRVNFSRFPKYTYSFGVNAGYKGFRIDAFFQGVQGQKVQVGGWGWDPFVQGSAPNTSFLNAWTPENHSETTPAVYQSGYSGVNGYTSTYSLLDASYLRLKNINISYAFTNSFLRSSKWIKGLSVFVSGDNLFTWTKYYGSDPENTQSGSYAQYPQVKTYSAGLKLTL